MRGYCAGRWQSRVIATPTSRQPGTHGDSQACGPLACHAPPGVHIPFGPQRTVMPRSALLACQAARCSAQAAHDPDGRKIASSPLRSPSSALNRYPWYRPPAAIGAAGNCRSGPVLSPASSSTARSPIVTRRPRSAGARRLISRWVEPFLGGRRPARHPLIRALCAGWSPAAPRGSRRRLRATDAAGVDQPAVSSRIRRRRRRWASFSTSEITAKTREHAIQPNNVNLHQNACSSFQV